MSHDIVFIDKHKDFDMTFQNLIAPLKDRCKIKTHNQLQNTLRTKTADAHSNQFARKIS